MAALVIRKLCSLLFPNHSIRVNSTFQLKPISSRRQSTDHINLNVRLLGGIRYFFFFFNEKEKAESLNKSWHLPIDFTNLLVIPTLKLCNEFGPYKIVGTGTKFLRPE